MAQTTEQHTRIYVTVTQDAPNIATALVQHQPDVFAADARAWHIINANYPRYSGTWRLRSKVRTANGWRLRYEVRRDGAEISLWD